MVKKRKATAFIERRIDLEPDYDFFKKKYNPSHQCGFCGKKFSSGAALDKHVFSLGPHNP